MPPVSGNRDRLAARAIGAHAQRDGNQLGQLEAGDGEDRAEERQRGIRDPECAGRDERTDHGPCRDGGVVAEPSGALWRSR